MAQFAAERMHLTPNRGSTLAVCDLRVGPEFVVKGVTVRQNGDGHAFVGMPSYRDSEGAYHDIAFPTSKGARDELNSVVLGAYQEAQKARTAEAVR